MFGLVTQFYIGVDTHHIQKFLTVLFESFVTTHIAIALQILCR